MKTTRVERYLYFSPKYRVDFFDALEGEWKMKSLSLMELLFEEEFRNKSVVEGDQSSAFRKSQQLIRCISYVYEKYIFLGGLRVD